MVINCKKSCIDVYLEIMIFLIGMVFEFEELCLWVEEMIEVMFVVKKFSGKFDILIGMMIEIFCVVLIVDEVV